MNYRKRTVDEILDDYCRVQADEMLPDFIRSFSCLLLNTELDETMEEADASDLKGPQ